MKVILPTLGAIALTGLATPALAQSSQSVDIIGTAEAFCTLPDSWQVASTTNNVTASQFSGKTWTINPALLADNTGNGIVSGSEVGIRVRGQGRCNTTHTITLTSANGGLVHGASASNPPAGFQRTRRMTYNAHWRDQTSWGITNFIPQSAGASNTYDHGAKAPPGVREFDVRMGLLRDPTVGPMLAGSYSDQLTVTITIPG
ncbi:MAG: hypothetical protein EOP58_07810 [Sphingomonadales bacterium]|nr:MAG: hypothetical protein EOP58_07810 [Sphingomonadales bacterium]